MYRDKATAVLTAIFDELAIVPFVGDDDKCETLVDILSDYPKTNDKSTPDEVAAYLYTSTARNAMKLAYMGYMPYTGAFDWFSTCLETAYSLLTEKE